MIGSRLVSGSPEGPSSPDAYSYARQTTETSCRRVLSLTTAALWGVLPVALKELLSVMDAGTVVWYRFLVAWLVILVWLAAKQNLPDLFRASVRVRWMMFIAALGLCGNYYFFSLSLNFVNAETSEAVIQLTTLFLILGGVFIYRNPLQACRKQVQASLLRACCCFSMIGWKC